MGIDTLAKIIMDDDSVLIAIELYEEQQLERFLESTSVMTDEDAAWACWSAAADRCVSGYQTVFRKAMSQYE